MKRADLIAQEGDLWNEVERRRALGGYSTDAEGILTIATAVLVVLKHLIDACPPPLEPTREKATKKKTK